VFPGRLLSLRKPLLQRGWFIKRIDKPTSAKNFKGEVVHFSHYYRVYSAGSQPIKYCKFQQIELLAKTLGVPVESLPVI